MANAYEQKTMKALVWTGPREMEMQEVPIPELEPDDVLIKVAVCGICGSELSGYLGHNALRVPPLIMGHEFSGEIVAMGPEADAHNPSLALGARVTADPMVFDQTCPYCQQGENHLCLNRWLIGAHKPGAFAEYVAVPGHQVFLLPPEMDLETGALAEPLACAVHTSEVAGIMDREVDAAASVLIVGAGAIGLLTLQVLLHRGVEHLYIVDTNLDRLMIGGSLGAEALNPSEVDVVDYLMQATDGLGVDIAVDAVGKAVTREQCVSATRRGGVVVLSGLHEEVSEMPVADIIRREITVEGSFCYTPGNVSEAIDLLNAGIIQTEGWVVEAPLEEGDTWFDRLVAGPGRATKVLLRP